MNEMIEDNKITDEPAFINKDEVTPTDQFKFAKQLLFACASIFILSGLGACICPAGVPIFDACKTILPPIVTLVIGYYFGETKNK